ncbi:alpha/beta hydrolase-fold protein [Thalassotalea fonticola]|uniref:Alpha/beta hydrolase-fold protein n=1 Tax=Thalassotalea fonticola TaxID=3065649 RepID=A0ABZ0GNT5_9GAMM|nr:alpha/beta hydrolase-fold protein [Colwelliaceae bacterium S1-1]
MNMKQSLILVFLFLLPFISAKASEQKLYEIPRTQVVPIKNTDTGGQYELYIKLPEGYVENKTAQYPVIYFTDAVWHIEMLSAATSFLMEDVILVGISWQKDINEDLKKEHGAYVSRFRDYSMRKSSNPKVQAKYQLGQAGNHLGFIRNDVVKYIENNYRTDPGNRTYFGFSAGGEFGAYILMTQPDTFKNYILGSPSLKGDIPYLTELGANTALKPKGFNANVFISYGTLEKELGEHAEKLITMLKNKNDKSLSLKHVVLEGSHQRAFPLTGVRSVTWLSNLQSNKEKS